MAHWRSMVGERKMFDVADLGGRELLVQVESARPGKVTGYQGGRQKEDKAVLVKFVGHERPLAFKATLCKQFVSLHGTGEIEQWPGKWLWLWSQMVSDPSGGRGAMCEAVRIKPVLPTEQEIARVRSAAGGGRQQRRSERDPATDERMTREVCEAIEAATTPDEIEAAIAPRREELQKMDERNRAIVASAKKARLATLAQPDQEGAAS